MNEPTTSAFLSYIVAQLDAINTKMDAMHQDHIKHAASITNLKAALPRNPDGEPDYNGHHDYHDGMIKAARSWQEIWTTVKKNTISGIVWVMVVFFGYAVWESIKNEVKK